MAVASGGSRIEKPDGRWPSVKQVLSLASSKLPSYHPHHHSRPRSHSTVVGIDAELDTTWQQIFNRGRPFHDVSSSWRTSPSPREGRLRSFSDSDMLASPSYLDHATFDLKKTGPGGGGNLARDFTLYEEDEEEEEDDVLNTSGFVIYEEETDDADSNLDSLQSSSASARSVGILGNKGGFLVNVVLPDGERVQVSLSWLLPLC